TGAPSALDDDLTASRSPQPTSNYTAMTPRAARTARRIASFFAGVLLLSCSDGPTQTPVTPPAPGVKPAGANAQMTVSSSIVISQVYAGAASGGALYKQKFVELFNRGSSTVSLTGW